MFPPGTGVLPPRRRSAVRKDRVLVQLAALGCAGGERAVAPNAGRTPPRQDAAAERGRPTGYGCSKPPARHGPARFAGDTDECCCGSGSVAGRVTATRPGALRCARSDVLAKGAMAGFINPPALPHVDQLVADGGLAFGARWRAGQTATGRMPPAGRVHPSARRNVTRPCGSPEIRGTEDEDSDSVVGADGTLARPYAKGSSAPPASSRKPCWWCWCSGCAGPATAQPGRIDLARRRRRH